MLPIGVVGRLLAARTLREIAFGTMAVVLPFYWQQKGLSLSAIAADAASAIMNMIDLFGPCLISVQPLKAAQ